MTALNIDVVIQPFLSVYDLPGKTVVVIDVLRASTTITTALHNGAETVIPTATVREAIKRADQFDRKNVLLCGERKGIRVPEFDLGNSPAEYGSQVVRNKTIIFTSSNGSRLLAKVKEASLVIVAGFVNISAVVKKVMHKNNDCIFACAGSAGQFSLEDTVCAGMLVDGLQNEYNGSTLILNDEAKAALILYRYYSKEVLTMLKGSSHGQYLASIHMEDDLAICASVDLYDVVPVLSGECLV